MNPTFLFIMWMCIEPSTTACPIWESPTHMIVVQPEINRQACEMHWSDTNQFPDPKGLKSYHRCQPIEEAL